MEEPKVGHCSHCLATEISAYQQCAVIGDPDMPPIEYEAAKAECPLVAMIRRAFPGTTVVRELSDAEVWIQYGGKRTREQMLQHMRQKYLNDRR
jgi:hypothetical protein